MRAFLSLLCLVGLVGCGSRAAVLAKERAPEPNEPTVQFSDELTLGAECGRVHHLAFGQVNALQDDADDLVLAAEHCSVLFRGDGSGGFSDGETLQATPDAQAYAVFPVNVHTGDEHVDVLLFADVFSVYSGDGTGRVIWTGWQGANGVRHSGGSQVLDLDRDGILDLAQTNVFEELKTWRGAGDGTFELSFQTGEFPGLTGTHVAHLDSDSLPDALLATGNLVMLRGNDRGGFGEPTIARKPAGTDPVRSATTGDLNADGCLDAVGIPGVPTTTGAEGRELQVFLNRCDGTGELEHAATLAAPDAVYAIVSDLDGDGAGDLIAALAAPTDRVAVILGRGDGTFAEPVLLEGVDNPIAVATADLDADGRLDVAAANHSTVGPGGASVFLQVDAEPPPAL